MTDDHTTTTETINVCLDWASFTTKHVWTCPDGRVCKVISALPHPLMCHSYGEDNLNFHIHRIVTVDIMEEDESHG
jgi:hypothetical protein